MTSTIKPTLDLSNSQYKSTLDSAQAESASLLSVAILNTVTGEYLQSTPSSESVGVEVNGWLNVAKALFLNPETPNPEVKFTSLNSTTQAYIGFDTQALVAVAHSPSQLPCLIVHRDDTPLSATLASAKKLAELYPLGFDPLDNNASYIDRDGRHSLADLIVGGSAEQVCLNPAFASYFWDGLFGRSALGSFSQLQVQQSSSLSRLKEVYIETDQHKVLYQRPRFLPDHILIAIANSQSTPAELSINLLTAADNVLRYYINDILEGGINTDVTLAEDDQTWQSIVQELRELDKDDLIGVLEVGGFVNYSLGDEGSMESGDVVLRCAECIYYYPNRKWCDLPELPVPVEPHWYCKLWKL